jgi:SAM-dependent methyltransferase
MNKERSYEQNKGTWEQEHRTPELIEQLHTAGPARGVTKFWDWLSERQSTSGLRGVEIACGKGRNVLWLAQQGVDMTGIDYSEAAIREAEARARTQNLLTAHFIAQDVSIPWTEQEEQYDFAIDCFATASIEGLDIRSGAVREMQRGLKPGGYALVYTVSTDDAYHQEMVRQSPGYEPNSFIHPVNNRFERSFTREDLIEQFAELNLVAEDRIERTPMYDGKPYPAKHHWMVFQKPERVTQSQKVLIDNSTK